MVKPRRAPRERGFTLLEILVALVLLGFLLVGLSAGVHAGLDLWRAQRREIGKIRDLDATERVLRALLTGIPQVVPRGFAAGAQGRSGVRGTAEAFVFVGDMPTGVGTTRRVDIRLELRGERLVLLWAPHRHEVLQQMPRPRETELIGGVKSLQIAYMGNPNPAQPPAWRSVWPGPGVPRLIRIRLRFAKGDLRHWPDLIAAPWP
jgi:general secretion pathway protein J